MGRYQWNVVFLIFLLTMGMHVFLFMALALMRLRLFELFLQSNDIHEIFSALDLWSVDILIMSGIFMSIALVVMHLISRNLVGSFGRIIREMDDILEGKRTTAITARSYDWLAQEVLQRINALIKRIYP